jgi:hypothetical protein
MTSTLYGTEKGFKLATTATLSPLRLTWCCVRYGASKPNRKLLQQLHRSIDFSGLAVARRKVSLSQAKFMSHLRLYKRARVYQPVRSHYLYRQSPTVDRSSLLIFTLPLIQSSKDAYQLFVRSGCPGRVFRSIFPHVLSRTDCSSTS